MDDLTLIDEFDDPIAAWMVLGLTQHPTNGVRSKKTRGLVPKKERKWEFGTKKPLKTKGLR